MAGVALKANVRVGRERPLSFLRLLSLACTLLALAAVEVRALEQPTQTEIESQLTCQCGCGLTVHSCNHVNCPSGIPLKEEIAQQLKMGEPREQILSWFEKKYGEKVLAAPTMRGFNLAAWTMPFIVIGAGFLMVAFILLRWRRQTAVAGVAGLSELHDKLEIADPAARARLEEALRRFDEGK